jgi:hypothetical protein
MVTLNIANQRVIVYLLIPVSKVIIKIYTYIDYFTALRWSQFPNQVKNLLINIRLSIFHVGFVARLIQLDCLDLGYRSKKNILSKLNIITWEVGL